MSCLTALERFWRGQLADMCVIADQPPAWCACILARESEWQGHQVNQMSVRDLRTRIWMEQSKAMGFIVAAFFSSIALAITAILISDLVMALTATLLSPLFGLPVAGLVFKAVICTLELINIALGTLVLIGKLTSKVFVPAANRCTSHAEALERGAASRRSSQRR